MLSMEEKHLEYNPGLTNNASNSPPVQGACLDE